MGRTQILRFGLILVALSAAAISNACMSSSPSKRVLLEKQRREAAFQIIVDNYSKDLKPGMTRKSVEDYLRSKKLPIDQRCCIDREAAYSDYVKIGADEKPWFCEENAVYIVLQFAVVEPMVNYPAFTYSDRNSDALKKISIIRQPEGCL
jgi:hypothetical protein